MCISVSDPKRELPTLSFPVSVATARLLGFALFTIARRLDPNGDALLFQAAISEAEAKARGIVPAPERKQ